MKKKIVPGTTIIALNSECEMLVQEQLLKLNLLTNSDIAAQNEDLPAFKKYYMHGVSHFIGLDVHDTGKNDTILEPGMILN
jgi:Xaa-Pro aminopeptidase